MTRGQGDRNVVALAVVAVLAALVIPFAGYVIVREPTPPASADRGDASPGEEAAALEDDDQVLAILGDGYYTPAGADGPPQGVARQLADGLEHDLVNVSGAGTGYVSDGELGGTRYGNRVGEVVAGDPGLVLVAGGGSDYATIFEDYAASEEDFADAVASVLDRLQRRLPEATIVVVGPVWPEDATPEGIDTINQVLEEAAASRGLEFVDPIGSEWISGSPTSADSGNAPELFSLDGETLRQDGHDFLAAELLDALETALGDV